MNTQEQELNRLRALEKQLLKERGELMARVAELERILRFAEQRAEKCISLAKRCSDEATAAEALNARLVAALEDVASSHACLNGYTLADALPVIHAALADNGAPATHPDTARLDWLDAQRGMQLYVHTTGEAKIRTNYQVNERENPPCHESPRAAIAAAMSAKEAK